MQFRTMLKSKIDRVQVTGLCLEYKGSIGIDTTLMKQVDIIPGEHVHVLNLNNGERFETYVIEEPAGSKTIKLYGPAARKAMIGDTIIILAYALVSDDKCAGFEPKVAAL